MRDRLVELLPLLLVAAILLAFYVTRTQGPALQFLALSPATPVPSPIVVAAVRQAQPARTERICNPAAPVFVGKMASLKAALGERMGAPVELGV